MKVSIITVCYNAERTIESTMQSVLEQDYPDIEYIIVDGASSDSTIDIIDGYRNSITTLISEPDKGISRKFHPDAFSQGHSGMPAHPTFFVKRSYFEKLGYYKTCYRIAGDYELLVRFLYNNALSYHYIPAVLTIMRLGGVSTRWRNKWTVYRDIRARLGS